MNDELIDVSFGETSEFDINSITEKRWKLGENLINEYSAVVIPLRPRDKIPLLKEWQKRTHTTIDSLNTWRQKDENRNLGLVLGSEFIAVDIDGEEGHSILQELSAGDIPQTVTYTTPSGGMRYIYRIREQNKGEFFKKSGRRGTNEHNECALLGNGCQTVLPYSIHPNGGIYEFVEGKSFDEIEIAYMPDWMEKLMLKNSITTKKTAVIQKQKVVSSVPSTDLERVCSNCPRLQELLNEQKTKGLHEEDWFLTMCLLISNGHVALARELSQLSAKHNARSEKRIDELLVSENQSSIRCTTLGCSESNVKKCFRQVLLNGNGEITNSPCRFIRNTKLQNEKIGFRYDDNGNFVGINGNVFARHILNNFNVITKNGEFYYMYESNHWQEVSEHKLKRILRKFFNSFVIDRWNEKLQDIYWANLVLEAMDTSELQKGLNYINVQNGLFNLNTMKLENHNSEILTTVQIPIDYDENAQCPNFHYYLNDVFQGDKELILLAQEMLGYFLCCSTKAQKIFILLGEGSNGKSLLCNVIVALCGEKNVSSVSLRNLSKPFMKSCLVDKLLNVSTENEMTGDSLNTEDIKAISSGDLVQVERKFHDAYQTRLYSKLLYSVNRLPYSKDNSYAITRRFIILPFDKTYVEYDAKSNQREVDLTLEDRIMAELNGILNFALAGLKRLQANSYRFTKSQKSTAILEDYKIEINPFLDFIQSCIEPDEEDEKKQKEKRIEIKSFLEGFKEWCYDCNHNKLLDTSLKRFLKEVRITLKNLNIPFTEGKSNGSQYFYGIDFSAQMKAKIRHSPRKNK